MANSYKLHTANGSTTDFGFSEIDGWISSGFLKIYVNDTLQTTGYSFQDLNTASPFVRFTTAPANNAIVRIQRETPSTVSGFQGNVVNFNDASVLTEADLDNMAKGLLHIAQEAEDTGSGALPLNLQQTHWDAGTKRLTNMADGLNAQDAVTMAQLTSATLYGGAATTPQVWAVTGTGTTTYTLSPAPLNTTSEMFLVEVGGVIQHPDTYTITASAIVFDGNISNGVAISIRNLGVARNINESVSSAMLQTDSVTSDKIAAGAVGASELAADSVQTAKIVNDAVTYAKIQNVSATDKVLGRSSASAGDIEEITCTAAGRALLDDADATAQRGTLGLGGLAVKTTISNGDIDTSAGIVLSKLATQGASTFLGNSAASSATPQSISVATAKTMLGIASLGTAANANVTDFPGLPSVDTSTIAIAASGQVKTITVSSLTVGTVYWFGGNVPAGTSGSIIQLSSSAGHRTMIMAIGFTGTVAATVTTSAPYVVIGNQTINILTSLGGGASAGTANIVLMRVS